MNETEYEALKQANRQLYGCIDSYDKLDQQARLAHKMVIRRIKAKTDERKAVYQDAFDRLTRRIQNARRRLRNQIQQ